ncbi:NAD(P)-binding domain-containing protein [Kribbella sp. NBC_01245]|uniref:NAD(P)-dependent oxidoreductase n=1 Tax=Kribbella sp. NBC_01245 TaxID=2903578 RepID=UPI002E2BBF34|nr:NAD(P)-binding domain-containing protein [Kribbella sp. NBC_01245]
MTRIAFIGLGIMGLPMATNLLAAGYDVRAYNRSPRPGYEGELASSVAEAVQDAEVIITMLPDSPDVSSVVLGSDGVLASAAPGALLIDMSSISPATARSIAAAGADVGVGVLDAPVSGGEQGAIEATLSIMVGGAADDVAAARPILETVGKTVVHVGPAGSGQTVKAANQLIVAGTIELVAEALTFLDAHSVDLEPAVEVLAGGLAGNRILDRKAAGMIAHEFAPGFRIDLHHKDLGIVTDSARDAGVVIPLGALVAQLMASARARGLGDLDHSALLLGVEALSGRGQNGTAATE